MKKILIKVALFIAIAVIILFVFPKTQKIIGIENGPPLIGIQPYGSISDAEIDSVKNAIEKMYSFEVVILNNHNLPEMAYTEIRYPRYRADSLLHWLAKTKPDSIDIAIGLTNKDFSITKYKPGTKEIKDPEWKYKDFGIFGLGAVGGSVCVVSSNRLHKNVSDAKFYKRLMRISCHEVGHVLGLPHCPIENCLMSDANESIRTVDNSTGDLCEKCWNEIH